MIMTLPRFYHGDQVSYYDLTMTIMFHIMSIVRKPCFKGINVVKMSDMAVTCTHSSKKLLAEVLLVYCSGQSAREINSIAPYETRDENVAFFGFQNRKSIKSKDLYSDTLESMNYEYKKMTRTSFWGARKTSKGNHRIDIHS